MREKEIQELTVEPESPEKNHSAAVALFHANQGARRSLLRRCADRIRDGLIAMKRLYLRHIFHVDLHPTCKFSLKANFDLTNPRGVHVGPGTYVAFNAVILSHDMSRLVQMHTRIGRNCFVGAHAIIMPGVTIGDECIIGAGSVVTRDVPSNSICAGNPATVIKTGIRTREFGILREVYEAAAAVSRASK